MFAGLERFRSNYLFLRYASQATGIVELDEAIDEARGASSGLRFVAEHLVADDRVLLNHGVVGRRRACLLEQHAIRNGDLPEVVKESAAVESVQVGLFQLQFVPERDGTIGEPLAMSLRIRIASLDDPAERKKQQLGGLQIVCETLDPQQRLHA